MKDFGWVLRVDLSNRVVLREPVDRIMLRNYIGGRGYATKMLYNELPAGIDPLSPQNKLIFICGPLTGSSAPASGRHMVVTKSPLTGYIASSNSGGFWGAELARAGIFALVLEGKAPAPTWLLVRDGEIVFQDASSLWGLNVAETTDRLLQEAGDDKARVACIGPAGERLSRLASIMNEKHRAAGRSGVGAVMGSKNLKAIVVRGTDTPYAHDMPALRDALREGIRKIKENGVTSKGLPAYGTPVLVNIINQTGGYPYRNWQESYMDAAESQSGETLAEKYLTKNAACFGCPIGCGRVTSVDGEHGEGPEYESIWSLGASCGVEHLPHIIRANYLCNKLGLDTISAGSTVAAAMELYEKGFIPEEDLAGGPKPVFGDGEALEYWIGKMGLGEGPLGSRLAQGSYRLGEAYGHPEFSMTVKKQEMPAYDGRAIQGIGLTYAVSNRGGCHVRGYLISPEILGLPEKIDPEDFASKPQWAKIFHDLTAAIDSAGLCLFSSFALGAEDYASYLKAATGFDYTADEVMTCGDRIWTLERLFNLREGLTSAEDTLPKRLLTEPIATGPMAGKKSHVPEMVPEYYRLRGWNEQGIPTPEKLRELGMR